MECILRVAKECGKIFSNQFLSHILTFLYFDFIDTIFAQRNIILIGLDPIPMNGQGRRMGKCWVSEYVFINMFKIYFLKSYDSFLFVSSPWQGRMCKENGSLQWKLEVHCTGHKRVW